MPAASNFARSAASVTWQTNDTTQDGSGIAIKYQRYTSAGVRDIWLPNGGFAVAFHNAGGIEIEFYNSAGQIVVHRAFVSGTVNGAPEIAALANGGVVAQWQGSDALAWG